MKWIKKGRIFEPKGEFTWMQKYGILPTPCYLEKENLIRIYFATSSTDNIGRITFLDVDASDPSKIINQPKQIILSEGENGTFDDCGVNPASLVIHNNKQFLYYVGYQRSFKTPFSLFPGLAIAEKSNDFSRLKKVPLIDRSEKYPYSLAAPFVIIDNSIFKMWLWIATKWEQVNNKDYLSANIGYAESDDGINWKIIKDDCITINQQTEFSVGRPWIIKTASEKYQMFYSVRYVDKLYRLGYAESKDGLNWIRKDSEIGIDVSEAGWDSEMICYPAVLNVKNKTYLFYNGNNNGASGFGYAELEN